MQSISVLQSGNIYLNVVDSPFVLTFNYPDTSIKCAVAHRTLKKPASLLRETNIVKAAASWGRMSV